jgi:hypothetical protein
MSTEQTLGAEPGAYSGEELGAAPGDALGSSSAGELFGTRRRTPVRQEKHSVSSSEQRWERTRSGTLERAGAALGRRTQFRAR